MPRMNEKITVLGIQGKYIYIYTHTLHFVFSFHYFVKRPIKVETVSD